MIVNAMEKGCNTMRMGVPTKDTGMQTVEMGMGLLASMETAFSKVALIMIELGVLEYLSSRIDLNHYKQLKLIFMTKSNISIELIIDYKPLGTT